MTYYKVVTQRNKKLCSAVTPSQYHYAKPIRYIMNKWTTPKIKGSKLFVFSNLDRALSFVGLAPNRVIYECVVKNPKRQARKIANLWKITPKDFWYLINNNKSVDMNNTWYGKHWNVFCDAVKLTKRLKD